MKTIIFCEGTTDLIMIQFVLQYRYDWKYKGFVENSVSNQLIKRTLEKGADTVEINSCGGMMNIPNEMFKLKDRLELSTKKEELYNQVIIMIDHDTVNSNHEFLQKINKKLGTEFKEENINSYFQWAVNNDILGRLSINTFIKCIPEEETGAIETIMLKALGTDQVEKTLIDDSKIFIEEMAGKQNRYLQKRSRLSKAIFNTYFSVRAPEETYDARNKVLKAYDWKNNEVLANCFDFLDIKAIGEYF